MAETRAVFLYAKLGYRINIIYLEMKVKMLQKKKSSEEQQPSGSNNIPVSKLDSDIAELKKAISDSKKVLRASNQGGIVAEAIKRMIAIDEMELRILEEQQSNGSNNTPVSKLDLDIAELKKAISDSKEVLRASNQGGIVAEAIRRVIVRDEMELRKLEELQRLEVQQSNGSNNTPASKLDSDIAELKKTISDSKKLLRASNQGGIAAEALRRMIVHDEMELRRLEEQQK